MTTVTHTITGLAIGKLFYLSSGSTGSFDNYYVYLAFCGFIANLPDVNVLWHSNLYWHHKDFTHYPLTSMLLLLVFVFLGYKFGFRHEVLIMSFLYGVHLFLDCFGSRAGLYLFAPIKDYEFSFLKLFKNENANIKEELSHSLKNGLIFTEFILICVSMWILVWYR